MEFLKEILGEDLYKQVEKNVNEHNSKIEDKEKHVKIADLGSGKYVSKDKYDALETDLNNTKTSLYTANTTIEDLKKNNGDNADLQQKISDYETQITNLETANKKEKTKMLKQMAIKDALYNEKAKHPELLITKFDLDKITLDENGEKVVSGIEEQMKSNKETYKDLFGEVEQTNTPYHYTPAGGNQNKDTGATDFVGIIKENQARKI
ncbi:MAG: phage scaffolding protein [Clostridia bacterium]